MAYSSKVGSFNIDTSVTAGNTQSVTGVGFQPKIVLFWWSGSTATGDSVGGGTFNIGFGAGISSSSRFCVVGISEDGQTRSDNYRIQSTGEVIRCYTDTGTLDGLADLASLDSDGFTLTIDDQFTQAYRISYLALGGTDLTNVYIGNKATPTSTGNYDTTGVGFQPDAILLASAYATNADQGSNALPVMFGMATSSSAQGCIMGGAADNSDPMATHGYGYNGECISRGNTWRHAFVSFGADGFTLNNLEGTTSFTFHFVALKGGQYAVGDLTTRTDGNDISETVGFQPVALMFMSANRALSTQDAYTNNLALSIGAGTSTSNRAVAAVWDENNTADSETATANYDSAVYANIASDDTIQGLMDIKSIDASGFTCVMDDADPSGCWVTYLAIGAAASSGATGTLAVTLDNATAGGVGTVQVNGAASITLENATSAATGTVQVQGAAAINLAAATVTGVGTVAIDGDADITLADSTLSAAGTVGSGTTTGTANISLENATCTAVGTVQIIGAANITLAAATISAAGAVAINGNATITLADATVNATGTVSSPGTTTGTANITLADAISSAAGTVAIAGAASITLADATIGGAGMVAISGALAATLENATVSGTGTVADVLSLGTANITLADATASATGTVAIAGIGSITLADATTLAIGSVYIYGTGAVTLAAATLSGTGTVSDTPTGPGTRDVLYITAPDSLVLSARATLYLPTRKDVTVDN